MFEFEFELEMVSREEERWLVSFPDTGTFQSYPRSAFQMAQEWKWTLVPPVRFLNLEFKSVVDFGNGIF